MISSPDNPKLKHIRALISQKKARDEAQQFTLENENFIRDALNKHPQQIDSIFYTNPNSETLLDLAQTHAIPCFDIDPFLFTKLHSVKTSCGAIAILQKPQPVHPKTIQKAVFLDGVNKPQNMGAIIRSAAAFNLDAVFISPNSCDPFHPESIRAMAGHCYECPIIPISFHDLLHKYPTVNLYYLSEKAKQSLFTTTFPENTLFIMGSETGFHIDFSTLTKQASALSIPMNPQIDSLNVAVTAGIAFAYLANSH